MKISTHVTIIRRIVVNGVEYHSVEELPPDVRAAYEKALATQVPTGARQLFVEKPDSAAARWIAAGLSIGAAFAAWLWLRP